LKDVLQPDRSVWAYRRAGKGIEKNNEIEQKAYVVSLCVLGVFAVLPFSTPG
jgi:hypothetical protein